MFEIKVKLIYRLIILTVLLWMNKGGSKSFEISQQLDWLKSNSGSKLDDLSWSANIDLDCK